MLNKKINALVGKKNIYIWQTHKMHVTYLILIFYIFIMKNLVLNVNKKNIYLVITVFFLLWRLSKNIIILKKNNMIFFLTPTEYLLSVQCIIFIYYYIMGIDFFCLQVCQRSKEASESLESGVIDDCELLCLCWESRPSGRSHMFLPAENFLQAQYLILLKTIFLLFY